jgi:hypothetical protein
MTASPDDPSSVAFNVPTICAVKDYYARRAAEYDATSLLPVAAS